MRSSSGAPAHRCCWCPVRAWLLLLSSGVREELGTARPSPTSLFSLHGPAPSPPAPPAWRSCLWASVWFSQRPWYQAARPRPPVGCRAGQHGRRARNALLSRCCSPVSVIWALSLPEHRFLLCKRGERTGDRTGEVRCVVSTPRTSIVSSKQISSNRCFHSFSLL